MTLKKGAVLKAVLLEADEDHLGVALIQPGSSRYEQMKVAVIFGVRLMHQRKDSAHNRRKDCNKGGTA